MICSAACDRIIGQGSDYSQIDAIDCKSFHFWLVKMPNGIPYGMYIRPENVVISLSLSKAGIAMNTVIITDETNK